MKKRIVSILLTLALLLALAACSAEQYDALYVIDGENGMTFTVRGSGTRPKQIVVKNGDEIIWKTKVKIPRSVGSLGGHYGFEIIDLNFDGYNDLMLADGVSGECISYICWLYDEASGKYVRSEQLSGLCNIHADADLKALLAYTHTYTMEQAYADVPASYITVDSTTKYVWNDGNLTPEVRASISYYSETEMYQYSVAVYDSENGTFADSDDKWLSPEEYKTYDMSFLYYFKK